jgi:5'-deoxynucleotidase YfbR-like HD superfamily hydrolase
MDDGRLMAAAHICRWRGWTKRHYSILEHMIIGTEVLNRIGAPENVQRWFLLHDMHETEICGDIPTPDKQKYCNIQFDLACEDYDNSLRETYGDLVSLTQADRAMVKHMDETMAIVEHVTVSSRVCPEMPRPDWNEAQTLVRQHTPRTTPSVWMLIGQWHRQAKRLGLW